MKTRLVVTREESAGPFRTEHAVEGQSVTIGRSRDNDLVLPDPEKRVSGKHARIERREGTWYLVDLNSKNGTYLHDVRLEPLEPVALESGGAFFIEDFRLELHEEVEDLEGTVERPDPSRRAESLADQLAALFALHGQEDPKERRGRLREVLRAGVADLSPEDSRAVLSQVRTRFGAESLDARDTGASRGADAVVATREALYRAGHEILRALSEKLLGDATFRSAEEAQVFGKLVEQTVLATLDWLSRSLKGRREFENQFSAELTQILSREKNPIKSVETSPSDIGRWLLDWRGDPDLEAKRKALEEAFKDLTLHQLALLSGVQESIRAVLERLDPAVIEQGVRAGTQGFVSRIFLKLFPARRIWREYVERHGELFQENSKLWSEVVYPGIRKGYLAAHAKPDAGPR